MDFELIKNLKYKYEDSVIYKDLFIGTIETKIVITKLITFEVIKILKGIHFSSNKLTIHNNLLISKTEDEMMIWDLNTFVQLLSTKDVFFDSESIKIYSYQHYLIEKIKNNVVRLNLDPSDSNFGNSKILIEAIKLALPYKDRLIISKKNLVYILDISSGEIIKQFDKNSYLGFIEIYYNFLIIYYPLIRVKIIYDLDTDKTIQKTYNYLHFRNYMNYPGKYLISHYNHFTFTIINPLTGKYYRVKRYYHRIREFIIYKNYLISYHNGSNHSINIWDLDLGFRLKPSSSYRTRIKEIQIYPKGNVYFYQGYLIIHEFGQSIKILGNMTRHYILEESRCLKKIYQLVSDYPGCLIEIVFRCFLLEDIYKILYFFNLSDYQ